MTVLRRAGRSTLVNALVFAVTIAACTSNTPGTVPAPDGSAPDAAGQGEVAARTSSPQTPVTTAAPAIDKRDLGIARLGPLTDPLPAPLSLPAGAGDPAAALAKRVMSGGDEALAALVAALQASGVAVNGSRPGFVKPAAPWQGVIVESWEVRMLLATVLPERTVTMTMTELAAPLRTSAVLKEVPLERLVVEDLRRAAASTNASPKRFWARFIIELGRDPRSAAPDLSNTDDPASVRVNGLQASLILRRLAVDLLLLRARAASDHGQGLAMLRAGAQHDERPCTMNDTGRTAGDLVAIGAALGVGGIDDFGFSGLTGFLESTFGAAAAEAFKLFGGIGNALLTYVTLFVTYAALEVKVDMDSAPLTRTKQVRPSSGERKRLTAVVRMNTGDAQILNCFRVMLNSVGLDLKLPQDGAVKGAQLGWQGDAGFSELVESRGGPDQIVRFVSDGGVTGSSFNSVTKSVTDDAGKASVTVEGVGQRVRKSDNAAKVIRHARVHVNVALSGADLFGDLTSAVGAGIGGVQALISLPAEMLYRSQWASAGFYTFEVIDWGGTQWSGTLTITRTDVTKGEVNGRTTDVQTVREAKVNVIEATKYETVGDTTIADMRGTIDGRYTKLGTVSLKWTQVSDSRICVGQTFSGTDFEQDSEEGSGSAAAQITVRATGLDYEIFAVPAAGVENMPVRGQILLQGHRFRQAGNGCANVVVDTTSETRPVNRSEPMLTIEVKAQADPDELDHLAGSNTTTQHVGGTEITTTITWDLRSD